MERKEVETYVNYSFYRRQYFDRYMEVFRSIANRCKFMMNISDEELAQYVQNQSRTGKPLTEKKLIGKWQMETADDQLVEREYRSDHTYTVSTTYYIAYSYYTGRLRAKFVTAATWELRGDSIYVQQLSEPTFELDRSQIHYAPEMEESVNNFVKLYEDGCNIWLEDMKNKDVQRDTVYASIDASGNKIEMRYKQGTVYFTRCDTP
jgi:ABC-type taurine transport system substrate-binding protein